MTWIKEPGVAAAQDHSMAPLIFCCPLTGYNVQGWVSDEIRAEGSTQEIFASLCCTACGLTHLVNPASREVLGSGKAATR